MACEHKRLCCIDCMFFCLDCGARVGVTVKPPKPDEPKPAEAAEKPKRTRKGVTK